MNTPQHSTSKITHTVDRHLLAAAEILTQPHDREAARTQIINAVLETLGGDAPSREIVDLLLRAMHVQHTIHVDPP
jgi:hypothetical protein